MLCCTVHFYSTIVFYPKVPKSGMEIEKEDLVFILLIFMILMQNLQLCDRLPSPMGESGVDCAKVSSMPSVSFSIGGKVFSLPAEQVFFSFNFVVIVWTFLLNRKPKALLGKEVCPTLIFS